VCARQVWLITATVRSCHLSLRSNHPVPVVTALPLPAFSLASPSNQNAGNQSLIPCERNVFATQSFEEVTLLKGGTLSHLVFSAVVVSLSLTVSIASALQSNVLRCFPRKSFCISRGGGLVLSHRVFRMVKFVPLYFASLDLFYLSINEFSAAIAKSLVLVLFTSPLFSLLPPPST